MRPLGKTGPWKHGMTANGIIPPIYRTWVDMKRRCNCPNKVRYERYGGRGIKYDPKWESFEGFYEDMGSSYSSGMTLDREDNDGSYCKSNCRWITLSEQGRNTSKRTYFTVGSEQMRERDMVERGLSCVPRKTIHSRLMSGWPADKALNTPIKK